MCVSMLCYLFKQASASWCSGLGTRPVCLEKRVFSNFFFFNLLMFLYGEGQFNTTDVG